MNDYLTLTELLSKFPSNLSVGRIHDSPNDRWVVRDHHNGANSCPIYYGPEFSPVTGDATLYLMRTLELFYKECKTE